jgi:hypothetical protein
MGQARIVVARECLYFKEIVEGVPGLFKGRNDKIGRGEMK